MDIVADIHAILPFLRSQAESLMTDTCTVKRATGAFTQDPVTLEDVPVYTVVHSGLHCKIKFPPTQPHIIQIPGQKIVQSDLEWHVPIVTLGVLANDLVTIDSVDPVTGDSDLVGKTFRVTGPFFKSHATARRFPIVEES